MRLSHGEKVTGWHHDMVSNLQCPATLLLVSPLPDSVMAGLVPQLRDRRVALVWSGPDQAEVAERLAASLNTSVTVRDELVSESTALVEETLWEIVDAYRGETVLLVGPAQLWPRVVENLCGRRVDESKNIIEVRNDGEGWAL